MSNLVSFCDFKKTKEHKTKIEQIDNVLKSLSMCQKILSSHKDYLIIDNIMKVIDNNAGKLLKIKDVETLHYENTITDGVTQEENEDEDDLCD